MRKKFGGKRMGKVGVPKKRSTNTTQEDLTDSSCFADLFEEEKEEPQEIRKELNSIFTKLKKDLANVSKNHLKHSKKDLFHQKSYLVKLMKEQLVQAEKDTPRSKCFLYKHLLSKVLQKKSIDSEVRYVKDLIKRHHV